MSSSAAPAARVHIDDLARPRFSPEAQAIIDGMAAMADYCPLTADGLHEAATAQTGLTDFGEQDYRERMSLLLQAFEEIPHFTAFGRTYAFSLMLTFLKGRLRVIDHLKRHPEIFDIDIAAPMIIAGLPRTGTTHLHSMLAADPALRALPYWEAQEPLPPPGEEGTIEPRRRRTGEALNISNTLMPYFQLMHEMTTDHIHEDIGLMVQDFASGFFTTLTHLPRWSDYLRDHDQTPGYQFLRMMLQVLAHQDGGVPRRWVLKSPQHLEQFVPIMNVFPDATMIITHRDPVDVSVSMATMMTYTMRMSVDVVDVQTVASYWIGRIDEMLSACLRDHDKLPAERTIDVRFDEFMADDLAMVQRVWDVAGYSPDARSRRAVADYLAGHTRGRLGSVDYRPADLGLDREELRARFSPYVERFVNV
ncbi:sulfotransferase [Mycolicibacterium insubricum]|uniref:Sulfotransferase family protein n=1 Tax=Mycolicibacterium insubricum TaxID=444597 RepID=A0A1X0D8Q5_9MYCO|nr:sulfotransferase [Mycolicibacterium insubricum]MCV7080306.1 sulfotransferase [Mycolicibacterium insubricum]ORA68599.1 sulfotransferase family protein [Mycolicibacterium insubricum]BBZ65226.1 sulfotransferase [Mycolicibacterium insubricum]